MKDFQKNPENFAAAVDHNLKSPEFTLKESSIVPKRQSKCIETYADELKGRTTDRGVKRF